MQEIFLMEEKRLLRHLKKVFFLCLKKFCIKVRLKKKLENKLKKKKKRKDDLDKFPKELFGLETVCRQGNVLCVFLL